MQIIVIFLYNFLCNKILIRLIYVFIYLKSLKNLLKIAVKGIILGILSKLSKLVLMYCRYLLKKIMISNTVANCLFFL